MQNGICEAFNSKMRDELLNETLFFGLDHARSIVAEWVTDYNAARPHSALGYQTPAAYAAQLTRNGRAAERFRFVEPIAHCSLRASRQLSPAGSGFSWMNVGGQSSPRKRVAARPAGMDASAGLTNTDTLGVYFMNEISLDELGLKYNCDKSSLDRSKKSYDRTRPGHDYLRKYEFFIERFRHRDGVRLLELGIGPDWNMGASLKIWQGYFQQPDFKIKMADINPRAAQFAGGRVSIEIGDLGDIGLLKSLASNSYDIIIDDASHFWAHQIHGFINLFPATEPGGVYIIEDIHTSFGQLRNRFSKGEELDAFQFLTGLAGLVTGSGQQHRLIDRFQGDDHLVDLAKMIDSVTFIKHSCIICRSRYY